MAAARQVIDEDHDVVFLAVGQGPLEAELRRRHAELGLGERFRLLGYRSDATRVLVASDMFALASLHEGYPLAVMEALAAGLPVVRHRCRRRSRGDPRWGRGVRRPQRAAGTAGRAVSRLLVDGDLRGRMAAAAGVRGRAFDIRGPVARTEEIYRTAAARH
jgi:glycosyltransferase involved in cell wall biosynthesis